MYGGAFEDDGITKRKKAETQAIKKELDWERLESIAWGMMGMSVEEFYNMIPKHFFIKMDGFYELQKLKDRSEWERTRWQTAYLINVQIPKGKHLQLKDLISFEWEKPKVDHKKLKKKAEFIKKREDHGK